MDFIIGVLIGAGALAVVMMLSMARAAKEADTIENEILSESAQNRSGREYLADGNETAHRLIGARGRSGHQPEVL